MENCSLTMDTNIVRYCSTFYSIAIILLYNITYMQNILHTVYIGKGIKEFAYLLVKILYVPRSSVYLYGIYICRLPTQINHRPCVVLYMR